MAAVSEAASEMPSKPQSKSGSKPQSKSGSKPQSEAASKAPSKRESEGESLMESKASSKRPSDIYTPLPYSSSPIPDSPGGEYPEGEVERAGRAVAKACHWVRRNPENWAALKAICRRLELEGELIQRGSVYERARQHGIDVRLLSQFRRDHNLWSVLTRLMAMERPSLLSAIAFRSTPVDLIDLAAYWRDIVGPDEFVAGSLAEARALWDAQRGAR